MSIFLSENLVLTQTALSDNAGVIGYMNYATPSALSVTSSTVANPASNMTNPATSFRWEATSAATQTITITTDGKEIDYIGIARHNLNQAGLTVEVKYDGQTVIAAAPISDIQALLFLTNIATPTTVQIIIAGATAAPSIAVLYIGKSLRLQRDIYVGHSPITFSRDRVSINGISENGQYLGEIVIRETNSTSVQLQNLTPEWYRANLDPFFKLSPRIPCFWAWRPTKYADEVGYCWIEGKPSMSNQLSNGMVQCSWNFRGIA